MRIARVLVPVLVGAASVLAFAGPASAGVGRSISGTVFTDADGDNVVDAGDTGIEGCTVTYDQAPSGPSDADDQTVTAADGTYSFPSVLALDDAQIDATCPGDVARSVDGAILVPANQGTDVTGVDFGFFEPGQLFGDTFNDTDRDGVLDAGEQGIDGCTVSLDGGADGSVDGQTQSLDGFFFSGLRPATFRLRATCPGLVQTSANPADVVVVSGTDQGGILFGFNAQGPSTTATTPVDLPPPTTAPRVLARTGPSPDNGGLGLLGFGLLVGGAGLVVVAARRRTAG